MLISTLRRLLRPHRQTIIFRMINPARYAWELACAALGMGRLGSRPLIRVALVSDDDAYCSEEQFRPFARYRSALRKRFSVLTCHMLVYDYLRAPKFSSSLFDVVVLKLSYRTESSEALRIVRRIYETAGRKKSFVYFDGDDDMCIQWPGVLPYVNAYVKKHIFRDRNAYLCRYAGKSNLHDYVHREFGHNFRTRDYGNDNDKKILILETPPVSPEHLSKIQLGFNIALDSLVMKLYDQQSGQPCDKANDDKANDIVFRGSAPKEAWLYHLRKQIGPVLSQLSRSYRVITPEGRVSPEEYYREMSSSKICVSPFGYGEICWRDFEAVLCRCLLIKPDMSHVETEPNIFVPYETYVPVKWDYSDLAETCDYYLRNDREREKIVANAWEVLDKFYREKQFLQKVPILLGLNSSPVSCKDGPVISA